MQMRGFSSWCSARRSIRLCAGLLVGTVAMCGGSSSAQENPGLLTDPDTGLVYRKIVQTIERPVAETQMRTQESMVYRPETVVTTRPESRLVYSPVVSYAWEPRIQNRWNPFSQPTVVYQHTPRTHWEARTETTNRQDVQTNWVAEQRKIDVPQQVVRMQREEKISYEPVGRVSVPQQASPPNLAESAIAARLRPLGQNAQMQPLYGITAPMGGIAGIASPRNDSQTGMRANELYPAPQQGFASPLPPPNFGVAGRPIPSIFR